jgi:hypothetical protein
MVPMVLFGAAALGIVAMDSSSKKKRGRRRTYTLDADLPVPIRDQVLAALASENDADKLESFATALAPAYPLTAAALRSKANLARVTNRVAPTDATPDAGGVNAIDPLTSVPEPTRSQIADQLARQTDASALDTYAGQLAPMYPAAATLLRVRAMQIRTAAAAAAITPPAPPTIAAPTPPPIITAPTPPPIAAPPSSTPAPTDATSTAPAPTPPPIVTSPSSTPAPSSAASSPGLPTSPVTPPPILDGLDPGMPLEVRKAVLGAITAETDPAKLEGFASAIQAQFPIAAGLLVGKAQTIRGASATPPAIKTSAPATAPSPSVPMTMSPYKIGDDLTRVGRNGGRPSGFPFIVIRPSDATYPAKIAKEATGYEGNFGEMTSLNPHLAPDGKWMNLVAGDALNVPWEWAPKLASRYDVRTDPGVTPSTSPVPNAAPLLRSSTTSAPMAVTPPMLPAAPTSTSSAAPSTTFTPVSTIAPSLSSSAPSAPPPQVPDPMLTYVVQPGDNPSHIAKILVHDERRWRELVAANPKKRTTPDGNFASLMPGERLTLPDAWVSTSLAARSSAPGGSHAAFA